MSGSERGVMASSRGEPFNNVGGLQKGPLTSQPMIHNMRLAFSGDGTAVYKPITPSSPSYHSPNGVGAGGGAEAGSEAGGINVNIGGGGVGAEQQPVKKKRGRPRKYGPDGSMSLALIPAAAGAVAASTGGFPSPPASAGGGASGGSAASPTSVKKSRGRPPGSSNKKSRLEALGSSGTGFTPYIITVKAGEDVSSKIMSFLQHGSKAVCILSANGAISNVTLRQPATSGGTVTYEGRFEILSLSGSFLLSEVGGQRSRTGGLSVSLSGPDGQVLGGGVAGLLTAASPIQVVVGSFNAEGGGSGRRKEQKAPNQAEPFFAPSKLASGPGGGTMGGSSSAWVDGTASGSSDGPGSPLEQTMGHGAGLQGLSSMPWK
ncbi:AT-hook motif nuclear-localized protein 10-like [Punica granatum]|nr:AT-hook motif nuclear-localized protein 10-like [Punica granatum]XP_031406070.1 AT-hook motif nuclear-localized protein 10-like [Punica granatum]PKI33682.1 hypothetical protein CRG98_045928 [Punica granatum]